MKQYLDIVNNVLEHGQWKETRTGFRALTTFGEVFRHLSYQQIKTSTMQSRSIAGVANGTYVFCLPGSVNACVTAWNEIIKFQLDSRTRPCNLVELMPRLKEK